MADQTRPGKWIAKGQIPSERRLRAAIAESVPDFAEWPKQFSHLQVAREIPHLKMLEIHARKMLLTAAASSIELFYQGPVAYGGYLDYNCDTGSMVYRYDIATFHNPVIALSGITWLQTMYQEWERILLREYRPWDFMDARVTLHVAMQEGIIVRGWCKGSTN